MAGMSDYLEGQMRAHLHRSATFAKPAAMWISLHTEDPTDAGTGAEVVGGGYARQQLNPADANWSAASPTSGATANLVAVTFPAPSANWGTVTHFATWDAPTGGNMLESGALNSPQVVSGGGGALFFDIGTLIVTFA